MYKIFRSTWSRHTYRHQATAVPCVNYSPMSQLYGYLYLFLYMTPCIDTLAHSLPCQNEHNLVCHNLQLLSLRDCIIDLSNRTDHYHSWVYIDPSMNHRTPLNKVMVTIDVPQAVASVNWVRWDITSCHPTYLFKGVGRFLSQSGSLCRCTLSFRNPWISCWPQFGYSCWICIQFIITDTTVLLHWHPSFP